MKLNIVELLILKQKHFWVVKWVDNLKLSKKRFHIIDVNIWFTFWIHGLDFFHRVLTFQCKFFQIRDFVNVRFERNCQQCLISLMQFIMFSLSLSKSSSWWGDDAVVVLVLVYVVISFTFFSIYLTLSRSVLFTFPRRFFSTSEGNSIAHDVSTFSVTELLEIFNGTWPIKTVDVQ